MTSSIPIGTLYGISVGPGDPELLTLKGLRLLQQATVVAFPAGMKGKPGMAQQVVAPWLQPQQVQLALDFPFVQDRDLLTRAWHTAAEHVWKYLEQGLEVAFVCEGDVSFYSTFTYLSQTLLQLHPNARVQAIPGVCSPLAAAAAIESPLVLRQQRLAILPALYSVAELETVLTWADVIVLMKVSSVYAQVWTLLKQHQRLEHSYVIEWATLPHQVIHRNLETQPDLKLPYFSLMIIQSGNDTALASEHSRR